MRAEILIVGTELLLGQIHDTNATFIAQTLAENGIFLYQKTTVGDNRERIEAAMRAALDRGGLVVCSGGLGPTEDDLTRECAAAVCGRALEFRPELFDAIARRYQRLRQRGIPENNKKQATLPVGAMALENPHGTAPGVLIDDPRGILVLLPGPPSELQPMLLEQALPYLRERFGIQGVIHSRMLQVCGVGESAIDARIGDLIAHSSNPTVGLLASSGLVRIRIAAHAPTREDAEALIEPMAARIHERLPGLIFGEDGAALETVVADLLQARGWRIALLDAATGGRIVQRMASGGARAFAGARLLPAADERARVDLLPGILLDCGAECGLAVLRGLEDAHITAAFHAPDGQVQWQLPLAADAKRAQARATNHVLEQLRRHLAGVSAESI